MKVQAAVTGEQTPALGNTGARTIRMETKVANLQQSFNEGHLEPEVAELHVKNPGAASIRMAVGEKQQKQQFLPPLKSHRKFRAGARMASGSSL